MRKAQQQLALLLGLPLAGVLWTGCGSSLQLHATPDFALSASAASLTLKPGGAALPVTLLATAQNGFAGTVQVKVTGLPNGVTASPATVSLAPGTSQTVTLAAQSGAATANATVQFVATAPGIQHFAPITITVTAVQGIDVLTYHYDVARTGLNPAESTLTPANVTSSKFGLLRFLTLDGNVDAQPLYLSGLKIGGVEHNTLFAATEHDSVYAFDADSGTQLWKKSLLAANETTSADHGCSQITPEIGITATPVIDRSAGPHGTIFVVAMSLDASGAYHQRLHALDVTTGAESAGSPVEIQATYPGKGANSTGGIVKFDPGQYAERAGLLLLHGTIYLAWTSHCDESPYTGWLMAYSETTLQQGSVLNLTPNGSEGAIWMAGGGLAADAAGNLYFLDANGTFDTTMTANGFPSHADFGNGFIKVSTASGNLTVADYFEPYNTVSESNSDDDLGSGGAMVLPDVFDASGAVHHLAVGAGKDGMIYIVNRDSMGKFSSQNNNAIYQGINGGSGGVWATPAWFNNTLYYGAVGDTLKAYSMTNAKLAATPVARSASVFWYPGTAPSVSADGTQNGIVWAQEAANPAVLHAYDAVTMQEIYNSNQAAGGRDHYGAGAHFFTPMVANGKVFLSSPNGVAIFGLLP